MIIYDSSHLKFRIHRGFVFAKPPRIINTKIDLKAKQEVVGGARRAEVKLKVRKTIKIPVKNIQTL